jgi:hypothetical protein
MWFMRKNLRYTILLLVQSLIVFQATAQTEKFGYAITDLAQEGKNWVALRRLDFNAVSFSDIVLNGNDNAMSVLDIRGSKFNKVTAARVNNVDPDMPFANGVAAMAYDRNSNRIFYVPMYYDQLRYIDLKTMKVHTTGVGFGTSQEKSVYESITRMVIAGDGFGYALSTDGHHLYKFNTKGNPVITDMGSLTDADGNNQLLLDNPCMTAGGDMIADDDNNLYLIAARGYVFRISIKDKMANYLGEIKGMPKEFSANGAAVNHEGKIIVTSSVFKNAMYEVDPTSWEAKPLVAKSGAYNASDLGSSNLLVTNKAKTGPAFVNSMKGTVKIYPNPVRSNNFQVSFTNMEAGDYYLDLTDISGRRVMQKKININSGTLIETINLPGSFTKGIYMVKLMNEKSRQISVQKVLVERSK